MYCSGKITFADTTVPLTVLVDSGASVTSIDSSVVPSHVRPSLRPTSSIGVGALYSANGTSITSLGVVTGTFQLGSLRFEGPAIYENHAY